MALRGVDDHPKLMVLKEVLECGRGEAIGYLETMWHFTGRFTPQGNIGKYTDTQIEAWIEWRGVPGELINALVHAGWIDRDPIHRLIVHDWGAHADKATKNAVKRANVPFVHPCGNGVRTPGEYVGSSYPLPVPGPGAVPDPDPVPVPALTDSDLQKPSASTNGSAAFHQNLDSWAKYEDEDLLPEHAAAAVLDHLGLAGKDLVDVLRKVAASAAKKGENLDCWTKKMVKAWNEYQEATPDLDAKYMKSPEKFFGGGHWSDKKKWPWLPGRDPPPESSKSTEWYPDELLGQ